MKFSVIFYQVFRLALRFVPMAGVLGATVFAQGASQASDFPTKNIRIVVPWIAGGPNDIIARALANKLGPDLGTTIIVENRPGANGKTGTQEVSRADPDGHTLLLTSAAHTLNVGMYKSLPYDPLKDFSPVTMIGRLQGSVLVVNLNFPAKTIAEFVEIARSRPAGLSVANNGIGNGTHIVSELLASAAGIKLIPVPYRGTSPFVTDLMGGHIDAGVMSTVAANPLVRSHSVRALGVFGPQRTPSLPDVPTMVEAGFNDVSLESYYGLWAPAKTPSDRVERLQQLVASAIKTAEVRQFMESSDLIPVGSKPEEFASFLQRDVENVRAIFKRINIEAQ